MIAISLRRVSVRQSGVLAAALALLSAGGVPAAYARPTLPEIRTSPANAVPKCVTPNRLMAFLKKRNGNLSPRFRDIAVYYKQHGETWRVRWDYAFFQMAIETNFLTYRAPSGRMGDVDPKQNNFAGIGTTGGGVPGDSFPDVSTGVLGQIQHLVVYSGEMVANPVAPRTQLKQEHILEKSRSLNRPVLFSDLAKRWAADPKYGSSIEWVAERFRSEMCTGERGPQEVEALPWQQKADAGEQAQGAAPVRTVWSREKPAAAPAPAAEPQRKVVASVTSAPQAPKVAKAAPKAASPKKAAVVPAPKRPVQTVAVKPVEIARAPEPTPSVPVAATPAANDAPAASEPEARFAFFSPPAELASVTVPKAEVGDAEKPAVLPKPEPNKVSVIVPPITPEAAGPPPPPEAKPTASFSRAEPVAALTAPVVSSGMPGLTMAGSEPTPGPEAVAPKPEKANFDPPSGLGVKPGHCVVKAASFGGETTVLVKTAEGDDTHYVAVSVLDGFEDSMTKSFIAARPQGGEAIGTFPSKDAALAKARTLCPE